MSWSFSGAGPNVGASSGSGQASQGPDLEDIQTEAIGFLAIAGETKIRLLPQQWPSDRLPPPTASLLSISQSKGLLAAAGPEALIIATTDAVRQAYTSSAAEENGAKPFTPLATIQIPRVSQVTFSADGSCLAIAAEEGGGLAVYDVQALQQGQQQPAFQLATNGISVRALVPNPAPEYSHLFAVVLAGGQLTLADLKERKLVQSSQGAFFREGVSCVSWSAKGKQLVAGLQDGTAAQYDHSGNQKATIPAPPGLQSSLPVTTIYWLANDDFLTIHTPVNGDQTDSAYHLIHRDKASGSFSASKFAGDPTPAFGLRNPAHHFISRLKSFPPSLDDMLVISSTAGTDIGVFTCSSTPLSSEFPAEQITNRYTTTSMSADSRRATMPMGADAGDTSPIGMCIDLTSKDTVARPLPSDEDIEQTSSPLPALMVLNNEGTLSTWWVMYTDSIRQKTAFPGLTSVQAQSTPALQSGGFQSTPSTASTQAQATPAFGSSTFGQPSRPAFGSASTPGFGNASAIGSKPSPWANSTGTTGAAPGFGKPAFGSSTPFGAAATTQPTPSAFGATSGLGNKPSPWSGSSSSGPQTGGPNFGQPSTFGAPATAAATSGFAKFGSQSTSPFASSNTSNPAPSPFAATSGNKPATSPFAAFGSDAKKESPFSSFAKSNEGAPKSVFGSGSAFGANQTSAFGQNTTKTAGFSFGKPSNMEASAVSVDMMDEEASTPTTNTATEGTALAAQPDTSSSFGGFKLTSGFKGDGTAKDDLPKSDNPGASLFGSGFDSMLGDTSKTPATPAKADQSKQVSSTPATEVKQTPSLFNFKPKEVEKAPVPEDAPLPPSFTNPKKKDLYNVKFDDLPLPKDPVTTTPKPSAPKAQEPEEAPLPPDFLGAKPKDTDNAELPPIAGSPPVDLAEGSSSLSPVPSDAEENEEVDEEEELDEDDLDDEEELDEDDIDEEEEGEEDEEDEEGDDDEWDDETGDEDNELEDTTPQVTLQNIAKASSTPFGSRLSFPNAAEKGSLGMPSTTPAGLPKGPIFAPPHKESPRSPSPIRSISAPGARPAVKQVPNQQITLKPRAQANSSASPATAIRSQKPAVTKVEEPEPAHLSDDEDARIRAILGSAVKPTKILDPFIAHQDYIGTGDEPGLGGQIENVYRDINSMIDTLGLNARSLQAFVDGHVSLKAPRGRVMSDLDEEDDWCLVESSDLNSLEDQIDHSLQKHRLTDIPAIVSQVTNLMAETVRLRARTHEVKRQITLQLDPEKRAAQRNAPLDAETEHRQTQLRQAMAKVQKLVQSAEEQSSILRAELASLTASDKGPKAGPTVEAVTNTILKMTAMIEQKSGDVDVLEAQIRRLPQGLAGLSLGGDESPLRASVVSLRSSARGLPVSRSMNALATPAGIARHPHRRSMLASSQLGLSGMLGSRVREPEPERRRLDDVSTEEVRAYNARSAQRKRVLAALRETVEKKGTRVVTVAER